MHPEVERFVLQLDGELTAAEEASFASHVATCNTCRDRFAAARSADAVLRRAAGSPAPHRLVDRVMRRLEPTARSRVRPRRAAALAAAAAAIAIATLLQLRNGRASAPSLAGYIEAIERDRARGSEATAAAPAGFAPLALDAATPLLPGGAPVRSLDGYSLQAMRHDERSGVLQLVYAGPRDTVSVFRMPADLDLSLGPAGRAENAHHLPGLGTAAGYVLTPHFQVAQLVTDGARFYVVGEPGRASAFTYALADRLGHSPSPGGDPR